MLEDFKRCKVFVVVAARPNFMKMKPIVDALEKRGVDVSLIHTGQHYDPLMSDVFFEELGLRSPDHHLGVSGGSVASQTGALMVAFEQLLDLERPDWVLVAGDVNASLSCAIVGARAGCRVAHVEAGLRSRDWSMPEELNRVVIDRVSDLLIAPSQDAVENLLSEGYREDQVCLAGNVMIDTLVANLDRAVARKPWEALGLKHKEYAVATIHRPSNVDDLGSLGEICSILEATASRLPVVFPVHPRTRKTILSSERDLPSVMMTEPFGYLSFLGLIAGSKLVMTDSGGIQEETTKLGIPCLTLRDNTERPITVSEGTNTLVGRNLDTVITHVDRVIKNPPKKKCPELWDGHAAERIASSLLMVDRESFGHPTSLEQGSAPGDQHD